MTDVDALIQAWRETQNAQDAMTERHEREAEAGEAAMDAARLAILKALGAPKVGQWLPVSPSRMIVVNDVQLTLHRTEPPRWMARGRAHEAIAGSWKARGLEFAYNDLQAELPEAVRTLTPEQMLATSAAAAPAKRPRRSR